MPSASPNTLDKLKKAIKEENISSIEEIIKPNYCFYYEALNECLNNKNTELLTFLLKKNVYPFVAWDWVKKNLDSPTKRNQMSQEMINVLTRYYISRICCNYLEQLYPSVKITTDDKKIYILDRHKNEIPIDSITNTLDSSKKKFKRAYELLTFNHEHNDEAFAKMFFEEETTKIFGEFREYSDNLFIALIQRLLDLLRGICSKSTSRKENKPSFFKKLTECTEYLGIKNNINHPEQAQGMRPAP